MREWREWIAQMRRGLLELCLLNVLRQEPSHGYGIVQRLKEIEELAVSESTVYPILSRLKEDGYLLVRSAPSPGGPPRRRFSLSGSGRAYVESLNTYWDGLAAAVNTLRETAGSRGAVPKGGAS